MREVSEGVELAGPAASTLPKDLWPRAISGAVLAIVALCGNWAGHIPFAVLVLAIGLIMSWEWSRIVRGDAQDATLFLHGIVVGAAILLTVCGYLRAAVGLVGAGTALVCLVAPRPRTLMSALGVAYVGLPAIALIWLRGSDGHGAAAILFIFVIVWTTDTFAYFCGRAIGGPKLWPALSPRKTWAGTLGGMGFAGLAGAIFAVMLPGAAPVALALVGICLSVLAQIGDLAESALKRAFDVKNASDLIPGHGGFMDRMDGVVAAATVAALIAAMRAAQSPAQSLLFWS